MSDEQLILKFRFSKAINEFAARQIAPSHNSTRTFDAQARVLQHFPATVS
jgi:hypothetical protein